MKKILVLYAHPRPERSEVNQVMATAVQSLDHVTYVDLYADYPAFDIDVKREQDRLVAHDIIIFQHPLYWYSTPAILKEWQDLVLQHGFAYGSTGRALAGKVCMNVLTAGAAREYYTEDGALGREMRDFLAPFESMAGLCRMHYVPPFSLYGAGYHADESITYTHAEDYRRLLIALGRDHFDYQAAATVPELSDELDQFILRG